jgi:hypothetical protein
MISAFQLFSHRERRTDRSNVNRTTKLCPGNWPDSNPPALEDIATLPSRNRVRIRELLLLQFGNFGLLVGGFQQLSELCDVRLGARYLRGQSS